MTQHVKACATPRRNLIFIPRILSKEITTACNINIRGPDALSLPGYLQTCAYTYTHRERETERQTDSHKYIHIDITKNKIK